MKNSERKRRNRENETAKKECILELIFASNFFIRTVSTTKCEALEKISREKKRQWHLHIYLRKDERRRIVYEWLAGLMSFCFSLSFCSFLTSSLFIKYLLLFFVKFMFVTIRFEKESLKNNSQTFQKKLQFF